MTNSIVSANDVMGNTALLIILISCCANSAIIPFLFICNFHHERFKNYFYNLILLMKIIDLQKATKTFCLNTEAFRK